MSKTACVVGSEGGIGAAIVNRLTDDGWSSVLRMDLKGPIEIDVTNADSVNSAFEKARQQVKQLGLLVVASGVLDLGNITNTSLERWNEVMAVNLTGPFLCCKASYDWIVDGGRIVLISSLAGRTGGVVSGTAYASSKGGVESLSKSLAQQLAFRGITVNCVAPGGVDTLMLKKNADSAISAMIKATPLNRVGLPAEIAAAVAFLGSSDASFITGTVLSVNGGLRMD
jgi:NAD(P)-dependent dehydrogenase (short-subunit alcohol dehydrogenase family)